VRHSSSHFPLITQADLAIGTNLSTTIVALPALLRADPSTLAAQWQLLYDHGIGPVVSLALSSSLGFATLAYRSTLTPSLTATGLVSYTRRNLYIGAAVAMVGLAPYTQILMGSTNKELMRRATTGAKKEDVGDVHALVKRWGHLNFWRGVMLLAGAGMGAWATLV
jgi:phospholipase/lecithinase/hemolysin